LKKIYLIKIKINLSKKEIKIINIYDMYERQKKYL